MQVYISNKEIEQIAEGLVQVSCGESPPKYIDIDAIATYLGITVVYEQIAESDPGKIGFASDGIRPLVVWRNGKKVGVLFPKDTVVLETLLLNPAEKTRRRFVLAHELSHTPSGIGRWQRGTIASILTNEKYKGDAILNKTYIRDCLSKKVMINNGERPKYYVENNHPAIIDSATFGRVQEEMARRNGKRKVKQVGTKTEQGRYSSKYALTELLICGECGTPYRRCTWAANGKKKIVWRCINRLDYGKKYCHDSPSIEESVLQEAIMNAVLQTAKQNVEVLKTLKLHIGMGLSADTTEDNSLDLQIKIAEIEAEFQKMLKAIAADNVEAFDEEKAKALMDEKAKLQIQLDRIAGTKQKRENAKSRLDEIFVILEALANHPISYDDQLVRQILESVVVESKDRIKVVFIGGLEVTQTIRELNKTITLKI